MFNVFFIFLKFPSYFTCYRQGKVFFFHFLSFTKSTNQTEPKLVKRFLLNVSAQTVRKVKTLVKKE